MTKYQEKKNRLRKEINTINILNEKLTVTAPIAKNGDTGILGDALEMALKCYLNPLSKLTNQVTKENAYYRDILLNGNRVEIKTSCGEIGEPPYDYDPNDEGDIENYILPNADYIFYLAEFEEDIPLEKQFKVFTRNDFLNMLFSYDGRGKLYRVKKRSNGTAVISLQSFYSQTRLKASKALRRHIDEWTNEMPTVEEMFEMGIFK